MSDRAKIAALLSAVIVCTALTACTSTTPDVSGGAIPPGTARSADDTLRRFAPDGFAIGNSVAGGGHHVKQEYPDPFPNDSAYRETLAAEFGSLTPENQLKWEFVHPPERDTFAFDAADAIVDFAEEHGQVVRGHTLLWHSQNPGWLEQGDFSPRRAPRHPARAHLDRRRPLCRTNRAVGRRERDLRRPRRAAHRGEHLAARARARHHRRRVPLGARGRPPARCSSSTTTASRAPGRRPSPTSTSSANSSRRACPSAGSGSRDT